MSDELRLRQVGIQPTAQRLAIAAFVLHSVEHPTAETVLERVRATLPVVSRATVYNTLRLFVERGLLREVSLVPGPLQYDPNTEPHHHFIDTETQALRDVPWHAVRVVLSAELTRCQIARHSVLLFGRLSDLAHEETQDT